MFLPFSLIWWKSVVFLIIIMIIIMMMILILILIIIIIKIFTVISYWLGTFRLIDCLFVSNRFLIPIHDSIIIKISILSVWFTIFLCHFQWHWIRIVVSIDQPFILIIIIMIITNDPSITYWTFTNGNDSNLPIIIKWWFELGFAQYW